MAAERPYLVTELCRGGTLAHVALSKWTAHEKMKCYQGICAGFAYLWENGLTKSDHNFKNIFLRENKTPVIGDFESAQKITTDAEGVKSILGVMGYGFYELVTGREFNPVYHEERRIDKKIEALTDQLEELKQQKAELN